MAITSAAANDQALKTKSAYLTFDHWAFVFALAAMFVTVVAFWPGLPPGVVKNFSFLSLTLASLVCWLVGRLQAGNVSLPNRWLLASGGVLILVTLSAAAVSGNFYSSLVGLGGERETVMMVGALVLLTLLTSLLFTTKTRRLYGLVILILAFYLVFLWQALRLLFGNFTGLDFFASPAVNLIGKWNDLAIWFGLILVMTTILWEFWPNPRSRALNSLLSLTWLLALGGVVFTNFPTVWPVLAAMALVIFVYRLIGWFGQSPAEGGTKTLTILQLSFLVLLVALAFLVLGGQGSPARPDETRLDCGQAGGPLYRLVSCGQEKAGINNLELRPAWLSTGVVVRNALTHRPALGFGPNKFILAWERYKPLPINETIFWSLDFNSGVSFLATIAVTVGVIGLLAWLGWLAVLLVWIVPLVWRPTADPLARAVDLALFGGFIFLLPFLFLYVSDIVILTLTFWLGGFGLAARGAAAKPITYDFSDRPKQSLFTISALIVLIILTIITLYLVVQLFWSNLNYYRGENLVGQGRLDAGEEKIRQAINLSRRDLYYRTLTTVYLTKLNQLLNDQTLSPETARANFGTLFAQAVDGALTARNLDPTNYLNWQTLAQVYTLGANLRIPGAADQAIASQRKIGQLNPTNPAWLLALARLADLGGDRESARQYLQQALTLKSNYSEAIFLLANWDAGAGRLGEAIKRIEAALNGSPNDLGLLFQLGFWRYRNGDYEAAVAPLSRAVALSPNYANARYFLGLSLAQVGKINEALENFQIIERLNPDNQEVRRIINNLEAGFPPLAGIAPPPEKRTVPPVKEK